MIPRLTIRTNLRVLVFLFFAKLGPSQNQAKIDCPMVWAKKTSEVSQVVLADFSPLLHLCKNDSSMVRAHFFFLFENCLSTNDEKTFLWASLEPQGPRDPPCVKERTLLFRIALRRVLYDQMAPQLCPFYVP